MYKSFSDVDTFINEVRGLKQEQKLRERVNRLQAQAKLQLRGPTKTQSSSSSSNSEPSEALRTVRAASRISPSSLTTSVSGVMSCEMA